MPEGVRSPGEDDEEEEERRIAQRGGQRFDSISEEIKALNSGLIEESELSTAPTVDNRAGCPHCGRKFVPARLERHVKVCEDLQLSASQHLHDGAS